jgi:hypothetical protein
VEQVIKEYAAMDAMASEILSDKQQVCLDGNSFMFHRTLTFYQIIDLDGRRNKGREALRKLKENQRKGMQLEVPSCLWYRHNNPHPSKPRLSSPSLEPRLTFGAGAWVRG